MPPFFIVPRSGTPQFFTFHSSLFSEKSSPLHPQRTAFYFTYSHTARAIWASRISGMPHTKYQCFVL
mgnify:CR=1 FL=1